MQTGIRLIACRVGELCGDESSIFDKATILWYSFSMRNEKGQFIKGERAHPETEFKAGQHWRPRKLYWDRDWLFNEYVTKVRSALDIANQESCTENNILFWLHKHNIPRRSMREIRSIKKWGACGKDNPMYGKRGKAHPNWQGGLTPLRQQFYSKSEWQEVSRKVHARDKVCRLCGGSENLEIHHIQAFPKAPLFFFDAGNLILLCRKCHRALKARGKYSVKKFLQILVGRG